MASGMKLDPDVVVPPTARGRARREAIVDAAEQLFADQGFHATGIDEIGAAAGITGPGIYRHFEGKDAILLAVLDRVWYLLRDGLTRSADLPNGQALQVLLDGHLDLAIDHPGSVIVLVREMRHVPDEYRQRATANEARIVDAWAARLVALRSGLEMERARLATRALHSMVVSVAVDPTRQIAKAEKRTLITQMVHACVAAL